MGFVVAARTLGVMQAASEAMKSNAGTRMSFFELVEKQVSAGFLFLNL